MRATRSFDRIATVVNENGVDLGFLSLNGETSTLLLLSDVRFVLWLARRKYQNLELPSVVTQALDEARRDYFRIAAVMALIVVMGFAMALSNRFA